ncbi:MAG: FAD:protein FMN transferase [Rhodospirillales bacterium]|nr:FAD:protein FMN transferase [Rhodospirillales bacterium]
MISRRQFIVRAAASGLLGAVPFSAWASEAHVETGPAFGSAWRLVLASRQDADQARAAITAIVGRIDQRMSPFHAGSELFRFNALGAPAAPQVLSEETARVTALALEIAGASGGAFDPTSAPFVRKFGFGPDTIAPDRPAGHYQDLRLAGRKLSTSRPGMTLDLCATAKGYALDQIVAALDGLDFLIELGGEIAARGKHPSGRAWRMGIERPGSDALQRVIDAGGDALATSANGQEGYRYSGHLYGHVVDPRSQLPVNNGVASVSVLAASGQLADSLATAALVLGPKQATPLLKTYEASALFLMYKGTDIEEVDIQGFTRRQTG